MIANDPKYKMLFSYRVFVEDFLRHLYRDEGPLEDKFDLSTLRQATSEHVTPEFKTRCSDTVWVCDQASSGVTVCFCLEFQSQARPRMPVRMAGYGALLLDSMTNEASADALRRMCPAVALVVIYHGPGRWNVGKDVRTTYAETGMDAIQSRLLSAPYEVVEERWIADGSLDTQLLYPALLRMVYSEDYHQVVDAWRAVRKRLAGEEHDALRERFVDLVRDVVFLKFKGMMTIDEEDSMSTIEERFAESVENWSLKLERKAQEKGMQQGIQKGIQKGMKQGMQSVLQDQLANKFGTLPEAVRRRIDSADCGQLQRWAVRLVQAGEIDQVFAE